jgi:hypothetical protein
MIKKHVMLVSWTVARQINSTKRPIRVHEWLYHLSQPKACMRASNRTSAYRQLSSTDHLCSYVHFTSHEFYACGWIYSYERELGKPRANRCFAATGMQAWHSQYMIIRQFCMKLCFCRHLWADCLNNVGSLTSHKPIGLHGLLRG